MAKGTVMCPKNARKWREGDLLRQKLFILSHAGEKIVQVRHVLLRDEVGLQVPGLWQQHLQLRPDSERGREQPVLRLPRQRELP